jgi:SAM-dependent methyltransferase
VPSRCHGRCAFMASQTAPIKQSNEKAWLGHTALRDRVNGSIALRTLNNLRMQVSASCKRDRFIIKHLKQQARKAGRPLQILDVGCGGGRLYLKRYGEVRGVEPDDALRRLAERDYAEVKPGLANEIPYPDASFDVVTLIDVFGHIEKEQKDSSILEMFRVLRPGGIFIGFIECDAENFWYRTAKRRPDLFKKHFVDRLGHFGLEFATEADARFRRLGAQPVEVRATDGLISAIGYLNCIFGRTEYLQLFKWLVPLVACSKLLSFSFISGEFFNTLFCPVSLLADRLSPANQCTALMACYRKAT